ncbi:hypothetical protein GW17_00018531 [Ensete ventricosum]|nr:hypothetical protein GW17_00018531 [Ensete ventricosum]
MYHPLPGNTTNWSYFHPVTTQNQPVTIDVNRRRPLSGDNNRFRSSVANFERYSRERKKKSEKKRENLEIRRCSPDPDPSPAGFSALREENLWRSRGEENDTRCVGFSPRFHGEISSPRAIFLGRRHFFSPHGEKKRLPTWGEGTRQLCEDQEYLVKKCL